jgi:hypothetical protein
VERCLRAREVDPEEHHSGKRSTGTVGIEPQSFTRASGHSKNRPSNKTLMCKGQPKIRIRQQILADHAVAAVIERLADNLQTMKRRFTSVCSMLYLFRILHPSVFDELSVGSLTTLTPCAADIPNLSSQSNEATYLMEKRLANE